MKKRFVLCAVMLLGLWARGAEGSWFIDAKRFHISAHGQTSCRDCHEGIGERALHPDPADVNRTPSDFFRIDQCLTCHDNIMDQLKSGVHGAKRGVEEKRYSQCLECHRPHELLRQEEGGRNRFNPSKPPQDQCGVCHEERAALPKLSPEDDLCMACHRAVEPEDPESALRIARFCFHCHAGGKGVSSEFRKGAVPLVDQSSYVTTPHAKVACTVCHPTAAQFKHGSQQPGDCTQCHRRHDEKMAHDAHAGVACEACHMTDVLPVRNPETGHIAWTRQAGEKGPSQIHGMVETSDESSCRRCHFKGNPIGASAMILPPKSVICMPCHAGTFSAGDTTTLVSLLVFVIGMAIIGAYWLSGSIAGEADAGPPEKIGVSFWKGLKTVCKTLLLDVLLQRRLYRQSQARWIIHSLIFLPFVFRFFWGIIALVGSLWWPEQDFVWVMLDKNHPVTAFLFDLTGVSVLAGVVLAFIRGASKQGHRVSGLPRQDRVALGLIAGIVVVGFILEGMRMAMTGFPRGSEYALVGYALGEFVRDTAGLTGVYGYVWYLHAVMTGAFIAYLPFSRLMHVILGPLVLVMNAVSERKRHT